ncbi:MAG: cation:proton antiporter [Elusimicrobiota bacterium]|jgi:CPA2 family monovalent cation:H+ antiporter-2|nr:cation:proton antiporter [Elusimicrobiota bacterium]
MESYQLLELMAIGFAAALILGYITQRIGLSSIVGYLLAGFLIGPASPGFTADYSLASQLSEAGVILLMFAVGLHFKTEDLVAVKNVAIPGAIVQSAAAAVIGTFASLYLGMDIKSALILGFGLSVASTVVLLRVLSDNSSLDNIHGHVAVGWLVVEDILTILILVILPSLSVILTNISTTSGSIEILKSVSIALCRVSLLWILVIYGGGKIIPKILSEIAKTRSQELFTIAILVIAFTTAIMAAFVFQTSFALGAFLGGMVVGKSKLGHQAGADMLPLKDTFAVLFFLSVGMLFDFKFILQYPFLIVSCLVIVLLIKPLVALITVTVLGYSPKTALTVAVGLSQIGEFSFILANEAERLGLAGNTVYNTIVVCAIVSITLNPLAFKQIAVVEKYLKLSPKLWNFLNFIADKKTKRREAKTASAVKNLPPTEEYLSNKTAIVVGYGPTGKNIVEVLLKYAVHPIIIEMNIDTVNSLAVQGQVAIYGNCTKKNILIAAGIQSANYVIITVPSLNITTQTALLVSTLNPDAKIFARIRFLNDKKYLEQIGVSGMSIEEEEVSKSLINIILGDLEGSILEEAAQESIKKE